MSASSPIDVVLGGAHEPSKRRRVTRGAAWLSALLVHALIVVAAMRSGPSLEAWSAELALEVHEALVDDQVIELATPPVVQPTPQPPVEAQRVVPSSPSHHHSAAPPTPEPASPTQAAEVVTQDEAPVDLTGTTVVTGTAVTATGGATATTGSVTDTPGSSTDTPAVGAQRAVPNLSPHPALSRPVQLDPAQWRCEWPDEAVSAEIYDQAVVLRVVVRPDGRVEAAQLVDDPGNGFGRAALACAKRTRFTPALDAAGNPTRALSPPIRVSFVR